ncbi:MAG: efflux RND transporter permease subunit, partial [Bradyrhizobium sp.]|nr:efflux RND transporter permease subunit [Bradyrhizobium sp.]
QVRDVMRQNANVRDPQFDWNEQSPYLKLVVDQDRARAIGLTPQDVSQSLAMLISGVQVTTIRDGIEKVGVIARAVPSERLDLAGVGDLTITSRNGVAVPLQQIAKIEYSHEEPILRRRNRDMAITVRSDVADGVQAPDVTNQIWPKLADIRSHLDPAYRIEMGGAIEESAKGNASIFAVIPLMLLVMVSLLMVQLRSFSRTGIALAMAPFGLIGVVGAMLPTGTAMGFVAQLGVIALAGMIIRNAVILIEEADINVAGGMATDDAIKAAARHRARPILLTALAAILGMIPIAPQVFWGPMAFAIIGGLAAATLLTLTLLPVILSLLFAAEARRQEGADRAAAPSGQAV